MTQARSDSLPGSLHGPPSDSLLARRTALLDIPFPARLNSRAHHARRHTIEWLRGYGLLSGAVAEEEYDGLRLERLMAYFYPDAPRSELELATDINGWFFVFDDQFDDQLGRSPAEVEALARAVSGVLDGPGRGRVAPGAGPLAEAFGDLWRRATDGMPGHWCARFGTHWREFLSAYHREAAHRTSPEPMPLAAFLRLRRHSIGVAPCLDLAERCGGGALPDPVHGALPLAALRELTADVVLFVNDLVSLEKELASGDINNSVLVLRAGAGCGLEEAVRRVSALANGHVARFGRLAGTLPGLLDAEATPPPVRASVLGSVETMRHVMRGNLSWSLETPRYAAAGVTAVRHGRPRPWAGLL